MFTGEIQLGIKLPCQDLDGCSTCINGGQSKGQRIQLHASQTPGVMSGEWWLLMHQIISVLEFSHDNSSAKEKVTV